MFYPHHFHYMINSVQQPVSLFQTFLVEFLAGLFVAILATWLVPSYLEWRKVRKSKIYLCLRDRSQIFQLIKDGEDHYKGVLNLDIKNSSPFSLKDVSLNLYLYPGYEVTLDTPTSDGEVTTTGQRANGAVISCMMNRPIHPQRYQHFPSRITIRISEDDWKEESGFLYYYFSTEFGLFPPSAEFVNEEGRQVRASDMDKFLKILLKKPL